MKKILCVMIALLVLVSCYALAEGCAHNNRTVKTIATATCTTEGKEVEVCLDCNATIDSWSTGKLSHNYVLASESAAGNCTQPATKTYKCSNCGDTKTEKGAAGLHSFKTYETAATCTTPASYVEKCTVCGTVNDSWTVGDKLNHSYVVVTLSKATCTAKAVEGEKCERCGTVNETWETGDFAAHTVVEQAAVAPTCTKTGLDAGSYCSVCKAVLDPQVEVAMLPHTSVTVPAVEPTCTETGLTAGAKCGVCGVELKAQDTVKALGHDWYKRVIAPTETSRGYTEWSCTRGCGEWMRTDYTAKLVAEAVVVDVALNPYGSIVTDLEDNDKPYTAEIDEEAKRVYIIAKAEADGSFPLRELHLDLALIAELKEDGIVDVCFVVGDAEIVVPFASFEGEIMETVKADFPATLTGYVVTLDVNAVNAEGVAGCLVKVDMSADTEEADGIEMEITDVMTGMSLLLGETPITVVGGGVYTA